MQKFGNAVLVMHLKPFAAMAQERSTLTRDPGPKIVFRLAYSPLIPPNLFIVLALVGVLVAWWCEPLGLAVATGAVGCLYLLSMPLTAGLLMRLIETIAESERQLLSVRPPGAIIILAADARYRAGEPEAVGPLTLERLAEAARQQRRLRLPILASGGPPGDPERSLTALMSRALEGDFDVSVRWREDRSRNTFEQVSLSAAILRQAGVPSAIVVAHPWDMARALWSFRTVGYPVVPVPTLGDRDRSFSALSFLPQIPALKDSYYALHELIGLGWYRLRYGSL
jgi:uncharacterized SAM-binding protein YcdF (DUF218 family)